MDAIRFNTVVGDDHLIHVPAGLSVPTGEMQVTLAPIPKNESATGALAETRTWLLAFAEEAEMANPDFPADRAARHNYYAQGMPRE